MGTRFLAVLAGALAGSAAASADLRLFFSPVGTAETAELLPGQTPLRENPSVRSDTRLYLWAEMLPPPAQQHWDGISADVVVAGGRVTAARIYNYVNLDPEFGDVLFARWDVQHAGAVDPAGAFVGDSTAGAYGGNGLSNSSPAVQFDAHSEMQLLGASVLPKAALLGYVDVTVHPGRARADVYLRVGRMGISSRHPTPDGPRVHFGFGDEEVLLLGWQVGRGSPLPDARVLADEVATGACCLADGGCLVTDAAGCATLAGAFAGPASTCAGQACTGGCCLAGGVCVLMEPQACAAARGTHLGRVSTCVASPCLLSGCAGVKRGDGNCDSVVNNFDIDPFVDALVFASAATAPDAYLARGGTQDCWEKRACWADANHDVAVNNFDIDPFVACLMSDNPTLACTGVLAGDANCDNVVNHLDAWPFILASIDRPLEDYLAAGGTPECAALRAGWLDANHDGGFSGGFDRQAFIECLGQQPPPGQECP